MATVSSRMLFLAGLGMAAAGLAGTAAGFFWDRLRGRELSAAGIGSMQMLMIAAGVIVSIVGIFSLLLASRKPSVPSKNGTVMGASTGRPDEPAPKRKKKAGKGKAGRAGKSGRPRPLKK